jgi:predicted ATPase/DNA-binding winged helix-turn-helix (wHTH) protein
MYEIGPFRLDPDAEVLTHDGVPTPLGSRAVAVLAALVRRPNEHVPKSSIIDAAWPGLVVEESNLAVQISAIRRVLSRTPGGERWVETLARRGYRFVGPVSELPGSGASIPTNLPRALTSFVGRERELAEIKGLLPTTRLLTLVGVGGIGKTRLAQQVAAEVIDAYRDGAWFVDLAPIAQPELVASAIAQVLGVRAGAGKPLVDALLSQLEGRQILIVLDNCEHALDTCARLAEAMLRGKGAVTILATSREPLQLAGEQSYPLSTLSLPDPASSFDDVAGSEAVQLFVERARRHQPRFELTGALAPQVARLCIHLDGIPLALELAAARVPSLSIEQINERLHDRFKLLRAGERSALPRHQTLRATMDWSHELLTEDKREVLRRCAIFAGGFTLEAATEVAAIGSIDEAAVVELLSQLVARSLVIADTDSARARYRLLETTRAYALEKLDEAGETKEVKRRHARFFAEFIERAPDAWMRMPDAAWREIYLPELDNVRAALDWALGPASDGMAAARIAGSSCPMWTSLGLSDEVVQRVEAVTRNLDSDIPEAVRARLWLSLGILQDGAPDQAMESLEEAAALYRRTGDAPGLAEAMVRRARVLTMLGRYDEATALLAEALPAIRSASLPKALGFYYSNSGLLKVQTGDFAGARSDYNEALSLYRKVGAEVASLVTIGALADMTWALGDLQEAAAAFSENVSMLAASRMSRRRSLGWAYCNLSGVLTEMGKLEEALEAGRRGLPLLRQGDYLWVLVDHFALRSALAGNIDAAARLAGYSDAALAARKATRQFNEARARARLQSVLEERLEPDGLARLLADGARMTEDEAGRLALTP